MIKEDFKDIKHITQKEVEGTGADLRAVAKRTISMLDKLRDLVGQPVILQKNGLTSGIHASILHAKGLAVDFYFKGISWESAKTIAMIAISIGFTGIGIYHNGTQYSFHADLGVRRGWTAKKKKGDKEWTYGVLFLNPKEDA